MSFPTLENLGAKVRSQNVSTVAGTSSQEFNAHLDARNSTTVEFATVQPRPWDDSSPHSDAWGGLLINSVVSGRLRFGALIAGFAVSFSRLI